MRNVDEKPLHHNQSWEVIDEPVLLISLLFNLEKSLPKIRNVNSFRKKHLWFILCQKENLKQHFIFQTGRPLCARMAAMARPIRLDQQDCLTLAQVISRQLSITINSRFLGFIQTINIILSFADSSVLLCPHHGGARLGSDPPGEQWGTIERAPFPNSWVLENQVLFLGGDDSGWTGGSGGPALFNDRSRPASSDQGWTGGLTSEY